MDILLAAVAGFLVALVIVVLIWRLRSGTSQQVHIHASIAEMRSVGELVVFKIVTKEIVTAAEHWLGNVGKTYLSWLVSGKKMAMIFEFGIDFKYDLRSGDFQIIDEGGGRYRLKMPKCCYETHIRDISFYDEQSSKLLPWLLPDLLNKAFGMGFDQEDKNRLKEEARVQADRMARTMVDKMQSEVQKSARQTLEALAQGFGAHGVTVDFSDSRLVQARPASEDPEANGLGLARATAK